MAAKLMLVKGVTCRGCEQRVVDALTQTGARDVRADSGRGEVVLDPGQASERQLRGALEALGYRAASLRSLPLEPATRTGPRSDRWAPLVLFLPAVCCGAPLLLAAAVALGFGTWFAANRLLAVSGLALTAAALCAGLWLGRRGGEAY